jgi:hypothetical protein
LSILVLVLVLLVLLLPEAPFHQTLETDSTVPTDAMAEPLGLISPLSAALPPPPEGEVLTADQWATLLAIGDAFIPAISSSPKDNTLAVSPSDYATTVGTLTAGSKTAENAQLARTYLEERVSDVPACRALIHRTLREYTPADALQGISVVLSTLKQGQSSADAYLRHC